MGGKLLLERGDRRDREGGAAAVGAAAAGQTDGAAAEVDREVGLTSSIFE